MDSSRSAVRPAVEAVADCRDTSSVGRHGRLELTFGSRSGTTMLRHGYAEPPFRAARLFDRGGHAQMIVPWCSPGIFGGDRLTQEVRVERGARVRLTSQSAMQAHPSPDEGLASLVSRYVVGDGGELRCRWDPVIPFQRARLRQQIELHLSGAARLYWSDGFTCGRVSSGERWAFDELSYEIALYRDDSLSYLERFRLAPRDRPVGRAWIAGAASYFSTVLCCAPGLDSDAAGHIHEELTRIADVRGAADCIEDGLLLVRLMACGGAAHREALDAIEAAAGHRDTSTDR